MRHVGETGEAGEVGGGKKRVAKQVKERSGGRRRKEAFLFEKVRTAVWRSATSHTYTTSTKHDRVLLD